MNRITITSYFYFLNFYSHYYPYNEIYFKMKTLLALFSQYHKYSVQTANCPIFYVFSKALCIIKILLHDSRMHYEMFFFYNTYRKNINKHDIYLLYQNNKTLFVRTKSLIILLLPIHGTANCKKRICEIYRETRSLSIINRQICSNSQVRST